MTDDLLSEPGRDEVRCDHGDGRGWGHPAFGVIPWAHACCGVVGHCPAADPRNLDHLPHGAVGDWEIETEHGTRFILTGLGTDDPRWWRIPGTTESSHAYTDRPYRLAALRALPDDDTWGGEPITVGLRVVIGQGFLSDLWHSSRVVRIRRLESAQVAQMRPEGGSDG